MNNTTEEKLRYLQGRMPEAEESMLLEMLVSCDGNLKQTLQLLGLPDDRKVVSQQTTLKRFIKPLEDGTQVRFKKQKLDQKGKTVHVYDPEELAEMGVYCTLHFNVFPQQLATNLLTKLMEDSQTWGENKFYMFERYVKSAHTTRLYTDSQQLLENKDSSYNGSRIETVLAFDEYMSQARDIVQEITRKEVKKRGLAKYQWPGEWSSTVAICNRYDNEKSSVGFHSDQMTHLGPHGVISSVSLGATREFRLKDRHDKQKSLISVHLPHNSLIIMHAGCQEEYKHSLVPLSYPIAPHPVSGTTRINLTYRMYHPEFVLDKIPRCKCDCPMILRTNIAPDRNYKYIWQCASGYRGDEQGCKMVTFPSFKANF